MRKNWIKMFLRIRMPKRKCSWIVSYLMILVIAKECSAEMVVNRNGPSSFSCAEAPNCTCTSRSEDFEISCSDMYGRIMVRIKPRDYFYVKCSSMDESNYLSLPRITNITEKKLQIKDCPLPRYESIQAIVDRIGMQGLLALYFHGVKNGSNVTLSRQHFKGLETLELLNLKNNGFSVIPADTFTDLRNLIQLDLRRNEIRRLEDIFNGLEHLEHIELGENKIEQIPEGIFSTQKNLWFLNLWDNRLHNLSTNSFTGAVSLSVLDISSNNMEYLQNDLFYQMKNLTVINLTKNSFKSLPAGLFDNNSGLKEFRMLENEIALETLPDAFLANKPNLTQVIIKRGLKTVPENLLSNSTNLNHISLAYTDLESLPPNLLAGQNKLKELYLNGNKIVHLDDSLFAHTEQLEKLDLSNNRLTEISRDVFERLRNLKYLNLNNNQLTNFNSDALLNAKALTQIDLQNNKLSFDEKIFDFDFREPSPFRGLLQLKKLNLRNNSITYIFQDVLFTTTNLEEFDLSYNNITHLHHSDLQFLQKKIDVNLTNNLIKRVNFSYVNLFEFGQSDSNVNVYLEKNPIECECGLLDFVKYIKSQKQKDYKRALQIITGNLKCSSPETLEGKLVEDVDTMDLLCPLDPPNRFEKQCPEKCSCWLRPVDKTLIVNCSNLNLVEVPKLPIIDHAEWQTELYIENNEIGYLPTLDAHGYKKVSKIYATNNNLSHLTTENIPHHLSVIDISNNKFSALNDSVLNKLENMTTLRNISLGGTNPWLCNCDLLEILDFIRRNFNFKKITDLDAIRCTTGEQISTLAPSDICPENIAIIAVSVFFAILSLIIGILSTLYYKYQMQIKVWLYAHNWCLWLVTEDELDKDKSYDAFISYSHKDEDFVAEHLVPQLEKGPITYKLCLHARDWMAGEFIPNQIVKSVEDSRRTIVVLSPSFVTSVWGRMEFRAAHTAALKEGRTRVIVVIYEDVGDIEKLDAELKAYLTMNTYVKWNDPRFWEKLRYALPHPLKKSRQHQALILKKDEKIELTMPAEYVQSTTPPIEQAIRYPLVSNGKPYQNGISKDQCQININDLNKQLDGVYI